MTALVQELGLSFDKWRRRQLPLAPATKAWKGATCIADPATAWVKPGVAGAGKLVLGIFAETIDNTASTAASALVNVDFLEERTILWRGNDGSISAANLFSPCYVVDDQTVGLSATGKTLCGTIVAVDPSMGVGFKLGGF